MGSICTIYDLEEKGFDIAEGITVCAGDEEIYLEVLEAALEEGREKIPFIRECFEQKDFERYCIEMHGLKNAMKSVGAIALSEAAREQESAVKEGNLQLVEERAEDVLSWYGSVVDALEELFENPKRP